VGGTAECLSTGPKMSCSTCKTRERVDIGNLIYGAVAVWIDRKSSASPATRLEGFVAKDPRVGRASGAPMAVG